ncbi:MAG: hypothetical protein ACLGHN_05680 [Bacteriovoracia bacterium]
MKLEVSHNFVFGGASTAAIAGGGLMVWGLNDKGASFGQTLEGSDSLHLQLPPGLWTFYAMAWEGNLNYTGGADSNIVFGGRPRCGKSPATELESEAVNVSLTISNDNCLDPAFAGGVTPTGTSGNYALAPTRFNFCGRMGPLLSGVGFKCGDTVSDPNVVYEKGAIGSFRIKMRNYAGSPNGKLFLAGGLTGACVAFAGDVEAGTEVAALYGASTVKIPGLPAGGPGLPFHMTLEMFGSSDCDATTGIRGALHKEFINGIGFANNLDNKYFPDGNDHRQYVTVSPSAICTPRSSIDLGDHPFAWGTGSQSSPFVICSVPQFFAMNISSGLYMPYHFKLQSELDFNPYSKGLSTVSLPAISLGGSTLSDLFQCLEYGSNFLPIGFTSPSCAGPGNALVVTPTQFTGTFQGSGFKIKNLRLRLEYLDNLGLFSDFRGTHVGSFILENAEISGGAYVGAVAGYASGASVPADLKIWNITGINLDVEARTQPGLSKVGSIVGHLANATLDKLVLKDSYVRGEGSEVGGMFGFANNIIGSNLSAEVDIESQSPAAQLDIGGVIGFAQDANLSWVKHEGGVYSDAQNVGGILGSANGTTNLSDFYAISFVHTYDGSSTNKLGGIVGYMNTNPGVTLGPGYSLAVVKSKCATSCQQGTIIGGTNGNGITTPNWIYTLPNAQTGAGPASTTLANESPLSVVADMRVNANLPALTSAGLADWSMSAFEYPRFDFESHPCHVSGVSGSGDGSLLNPYRICHEGQYFALGGAASGSYHKLIANIRLPNDNTSQYEIMNFNANLLGDFKSLIGGDSIHSSSTETGHILNLNGSISNLRVQGMQRTASVSATSSAPHGVFVANNYGTLRNIEISSYPSWEDYGTGFVGTNKSTGAITKVETFGIVRGKSFISPLAGINEGLISRVVVHTELSCINNAGCTNMAGLAGKNDGQIEKSEVTSRLENDPSIPGNTTSASLLVDENTVNGSITDVLVSRWARFKVNAGGTGHYFHFTNAGALTRVMNLGEITSYDSTYASSITLFDSDVAAINPGTGTHTDVYRSGGRSGKMLLENAPFSCSDTITISIPDWNTIIDYANWEGAFGSGQYTAFVDSSKKLIVHAKMSDGTQFSQRITAYNGSGVFVLSGANCYASATGELGLYYSEDLAFDSIGNPLSGVMPLQLATVKSSYSPTWQAEMWDTSIPADLDEMMDYFAYIMGLSTTSVTPRTWELEGDEGLRLFRND